MFSFLLVGWFGQVNKLILHTSTWKDTVEKKSCTEYKINKPNKNENFVLEHSEHFHSKGYHLDLRIPYLSSCYTDPHFLSAYLHFGIITNLIWIFFFFEFWALICCGNFSVLFFFFEFLICFVFCLTMSTPHWFCSSAINQLIEISNCVRLFVYVWWLIIVNVLTSTNDFLNIFNLMTIM